MKIVALTRYPEIIVSLLTSSFLYFVATGAAPGPTPSANGSPQM